MIQRSKGLIPIIINTQYLYNIRVNEVLYFMFKTHTSFSVMSLLLMIMTKNISIEVRSLHSNRIQEFNWGKLQEIITHSLIYDRMIGFKYWSKLSLLKLCLLRISDSRYLWEIIWIISVNLDEGLIIPLKVVFVKDHPWIDQLELMSFGFHTD